jgi:hypothetical protein
MRHGFAMRESETIAAFFATLMFGESPARRTE